MRTSLKDFYIKTRTHKNHILLFMISQYLCGVKILNVTFLETSACSLNFYYINFRTINFLRFPLYLFTQKTPGL
jgi:hypothetical protein